MKKDKMLHVFSAILAAAVVAGAFSACANSGGQEAPSSTSSGGDSVNSTTDAGGLAYNEPGAYPIANQTIPLKVFMSMSNQTDYETNTFTLHLEEKTGIDLSFETCTADAATEKLNLLLTSGDYPDAFFARPDENRWGVEEGVLIDITPYLDRLPLLQKQVDKYPNLLSDM